MYTSTKPTSEYTQKSSITFDSFQYDKYYLKATNHLTDYKGRKITGAVGSGHIVNVHPTILNDDLKQQRYSGTIELNTGSPKPLSNLTLYGDIASSPHKLNFQHDNSLFQEYDFKAKVEGNFNSASGKKFYLPLLINDDYFGKNSDLIDKAADPDSGVPGTWYNIKKNGKNQLPLTLNLERDTYRPLTGDLNKTNTADCDYTRSRQPNERGWYNNDVILKLNTNEFNELNISSADISKEDIDKNNILLSGAQCQVNGGDTEDTGETGRAGVTYSIFGRKGDSKVTEYLSAVSSETFRIDKTAPTITQSADDRKSRELKLTDKSASEKNGAAATDSQGHEVKGSGIAYVEWLTPSQAEDDTDNDIQWPSEDPGLFSTEKGGWPTKTDTARQIIPVAASADTSQSSTSAAVTMPNFNEEGTYIFRAVDLAGNVSAEKKVTNNFPELHAKKATVTYKDTITGFIPKQEMNASVTDKDEELDTSRVAWTIEADEDSEYPQEFEKITGQKNDALPDALPLGTYKVTFAMIGTDSDGNVPGQGEKKEEDRNKYSVTLQVVAGEPPVVTDSSGEEIEPDNDTVIMDDTSKHTIVAGTKILIVDPENPYAGGKLKGDKIKEEVEKYYDFTSLLPAPKDSLKIKVNVYKDGVDCTAAGINTKTEGEYVIHYQATDASGCSVTMQLTYQVRTDLNITFHAGKGDFIDPVSQTKTIRVKFGKSPEASQVPGKDDIKAPLEQVFMGWGLTPGSASIIDPDARNVTEDVTYYAVYEPDENRDKIPDSEEAIFYFRSGDPDHLAYKYTDRTTIGIPVPAIPIGAVTYLQSSQIPEMLFDSGWRLKGWNTDLTGDQLLTTDQLCSIGRGRGSKITVSAVTEEAPVEYKDKVVITFFSSAPKVSPLKGGEGQSIVIDAPKPNEPVTIPKDKLPEIDLAENCKLEGWKTSDTGDLILEADQIAEKPLYGGKELTCIAYVALPKEEGGSVNVPDDVNKPDGKPDKKPDNKPDHNNPPDNKKPSEGAGNDTNKSSGGENKTNTTTKKVTNEIKNGKTDSNVIYLFLTSRSESGIIVTGDGTTVTLPAGNSGSASITEGLVPEVKVLNGSAFIGWKTSFTGSRLLDTKELCSLRVPAGTTVTCTAYFKYKDIKVKNSGTNGDEGTAQVNGRSALTTFGDTEVPLGSAPGSKQEMKRNNPSCIVHFIMLAWLILSAAVILLKLHRRKRCEEYLYPNVSEPSAELRTYEDCEKLAADQHTKARDYAFIICVLFIGVMLYLTGTCSYELPVLLTGAVFELYYLVRMKMLDRREKRAVEQLR